MDFLTFKSFISTETLIVFYYIGAIIMPVSIWYLLVWLAKKYSLLASSYQHSKEILWDSLSKNHKIKIIAAFITTFLFMELFWRMLFEFLIAYMQMRDAILQTPIH